MRKINLKLPFILSLFSIILSVTSCQMFDNSLLLKKKIDEEIEWANVKDPLKILYISPEFTSTGVWSDSNIEIVFNKSIDSDSFVFSMLDADGIELKQHYKEPLFNKNNTSVLISFNAENPLEVQSGELFDVRLILSKDIKAIDGTKFSREDVTYKFRFNSFKDDDLPVFKNLQVSKFLSNENKKLPVSDAAFSEWNSQSEDIYIKNHASALFFECEGKDTGVGVKYLKVTEELIKTVNNEDPVEEEKYTQVIAADFIKDANDSFSYKSELPYHFITTKDGIVKLTVSIMDFNKNESADSYTFYFVKDTSVLLNKYTLTNERGFDDEMHLFPEAYKNITWSIFSFDDVWFEDYKSGVETRSFLIQTGPSMEDLNWSTRDFEISHTYEDEESGEKIYEYKTKIDFLDETVDNYVVISVFDEAGASTTFDFVMPGIPFVVPDWEKISEYDYFTCSTSKTTPPSYNYDYERNSTQIHTYLYYVPGNQLPDDNVFLLKEYTPEESLEVYESEFIGYGQTEWKTNDGNLHFYSPVSYLYYYNCEDYLSFDIPEYTVERKSNGMNSGSQTFTVVLDSEGFTEKELENFYCTIKFSDSEYSSYFTNDNGTWKAEIVTPTYLSIGYDWDEQYKVYLYPYLKDDGKNETVLPKLSESDDNLPPWIGSRTDGTWNLIRIRRKGISLPNLNDETGLLSDEKGNVKFTLYYKKNGIVTLEDIENSECVEKVYYSEPPKEMGEFFYLPFYDFDYGTYGLRFKVEDILGNYSISENFIINFNTEIKNIHFEKTVYDDSTTTPTFRLSFNNSGFQNIDWEECNLNIRYFKKNSSEWINANGSTSWFNDDSYLTEKTGTTEVFVSYKVGLGGNTGNQHYLNPAAKDCFIKFIAYEDMVDGSEILAYPQYIYFDTQNIVSKMKLKDIYQNKVLTDTPTLINVLYSPRNLGENVNIWEEKALVAKTIQISNLTTVDVSSVPDDMYYVVAAHFADNTTLMSEVMKK